MPQIQTHKKQDADQKKFAEIMEEKETTQVTKQIYAQKNLSV